MGATNTCGASIEDRWQLGDETVVGEVLAQLRGGFVRRISRKYPGILSRDDADEVLLVAICNAWNRRNGFNPRVGTLAALLRRIVDNEAATAVRSGAIQQCYQEYTVPNDDLAKIVDPRSDRDGHEKVEADPSANDSGLVDRAMRALPEKAQRVLWADACCTGDTANSHQLAQELGICEGTVRWYRAMGRRMLKSELARLGYVNRRSVIGGGATRLVLVCRLGVRHSQKSKWRWKLRAPRLARRWQRE